MKSHQWQKLFFKLMFWLVLEIILNLIGLDDVADYSEFIFSYGNVHLIQTKKACLKLQN